MQYVSTINVFCTSSQQCLCDRSQTVDTSDVYTWRLRTRNWGRAYLEGIYYSYANTGIKTLIPPWSNNRSPEKPYLFEDTTFWKAVLQDNLNLQDLCGPKLLLTLILLRCLKHWIPRFLLSYQVQQPIQIELTNCYLHVTRGWIFRTLSYI